LKFGKTPEINFSHENKVYEIRWGDTVFLGERPGLNCNLQAQTNRLLETYCFQYLPKPGDTVIDFGGGLGEESIPLSNLVGQTGKVFAVEANPRIADLLEFLLKNNFKDGRAKVINVALAQEDGKVAITVPRGSYISGSVGGLNDDERFLVDATPFDAIFASLGVGEIDFLKMNIEGAEGFLDSGNASMFKKVRHLCISCHDFRHTEHKQGEFFLTRDKVINFLAGLDFKISGRDHVSSEVRNYVYASRK
jgi:FkbM family methyltransferase